MFEKEDLKVKVPIAHATYNNTGVIGGPKLLLFSDNYKDHNPNLKICYFYYENFYRKKTCMKKSIVIDYATSYAFSFISSGFILIWVFYLSTNCNSAINIVNIVILVLYVHVVFCVEVQIVLFACWIYKSLLYYLKYWVCGCW